VDGGGAGGVDAVQVELPGEEALDPRGHGVRRRDLVVVAEGGDAGRLLVDAEGVGADDGLLQAAGAALPEAAPLVDQHVVADVVPAVAVHVVVVDAPDELRHLGLGVVVGARGVVDHRSADLAVLRVAPAHGLVGAPGGAAAHGRALGVGLRLRRGGLWRGDRCRGRGGVGGGGAGVDDVDGQVV